jgi:hypothetical protein
MGKDVEVNGCDLFCGTIPALAWMDKEKCHENSKSKLCADKI